MNTLVRNSTLGMSRGHRITHYETLDQTSDAWRTTEVRAPRSYSKTKREPHHYIISSFSRRERAKRRQFYLRTYKLSSKDEDTECTSRVLKKGWKKAKSAVVKILAVVRMNSLRSCGVDRRNPGLSFTSPMSIRAILAQQD
ncbi:hypothetical protein ACHQM5_003034 [Ranunculus cassubicifolius]